MNERELMQGLAALADEHEPREVEVDRLRTIVRKRVRRRVAVAAVVVGVVALATGLEVAVPRSNTPTAEPVVTPMPGEWTMTKFSGIGPDQSVVFKGVAARSAADAWAVGSIKGPNDRTAANLALRWNGRTWQRVDLPAGAGLTGIAAISPNDIWTVGASSSAADGGFTAHWDGRNWTTFPTFRPSGLPADQPVTLNAVSARAADDVWAVGCAAGVAIVQHWDGSTWRASSPSVAPVGNTIDPTCLTGVAAVSYNDVWAVGTQPGQQHDPQPFAMRWNGSRWSTVDFAGPFGAAHLGAFSQVIATGAKDVWFFGGWTEFAQHWDGQDWQHIASPPGVEFESTAVGLDGDGNLVASTMPTNGVLDVLRRYGTAWQPEPAPTVSGDSKWITALGGGGTALWALGSSMDGRTKTSHPFAAVTAIR